MKALIRLIALAVGLAAVPAVAQAPADPAYPSRAITMIVPLAAGSAADIVARLVATKMSADLGRQIVVENAAGASGSSASSAASRRRPTATPSSASATAF